MSRAARALLIAGCLASYLATKPQDRVVQAQAPVVGVDYAIGQVVIRFKNEHMPSQNEVQLSPPAVGISGLDAVFESLEATRIDKLVPTYGELQTSLGQAQERTFLLTYSSSEDPMTIAESLAQHNELEHVAVNPLWYFEALGTPRLVPGSDTTAFEDQWNLDDVDERSDIDAPEAWTIEMGSPEVVVGIYDSGIMVDPCYDTTSWRLHSDFNYYFVQGEDVNGDHVLNQSDLNNQDDDGDTFVDNVIGHNFNDGCVTCSGQPMWTSLPLDWTLNETLVPPNCPLPPETWELNGYNDHGTRVGSIAVGKLDGLKKRNPDDATANHSDIVGVAPKCHVYNARFRCPLGDFQAAQGVYMLAAHCDVINISFGSPSEPFFTTGDPMGESTFHFKNAIATVTTNPTYDCVVVSSVGNTGLSTGVFYPARYDNVLSVGGIVRSSPGVPGPPERVFYSNWHSSQLQVDAVAPLEETSTSDDGVLADGHGWCPSGSPCGNFAPSCIQSETTPAPAGKGTSFAAPQVTGVVALVRSRFPGLNELQVRERVLNAAEHYWGGPRPTNQFGYGKVNAYRALTEWGAITTSTTWASTNTRDGKYYISGDLTIESGATLTIEPGTVVKVAPDHEEAGSDPTRVRIIVKSGGALNIAGTAANKVTFESFTDSPATSDDWSGILFEAGSSGSISHAVFKNAERAIEAHAPLVLNDCTFIDCEVAIDAWGNVAANRTIIADNTATLCAVDLHGVGGGFTNCTFANNAGAAVGIRHNGSTLFNKCVAAFNGGPAVRVIDGTTTAVVGSSVLYGNTSVSGSLSDEQWVTEGDNVIHQDPAFCDGAEGNYTLFAFSPAAAGPYFMERAGALDIACVPSAVVVTTPNGVLAACPIGDGPGDLVVSVDLDNAVMTRNVEADEIRLDIADLSASVFEADGIVSAVTNAVAPDYVTSMVHDAFGGCSQGEAVDVLLNGTPLAQQATVTIRSPDLDGSGWVNVIDYAAFTNGYPVDPAINDCRDFNNDSKVNAIDFAFFAAHNGHDSPYSPANAPREIFQSSASVALGFTEEYPTATTHRLYVDVDVENFGNVTTALFAVAPGSNRLTFLEWQPAGESLGTVMCTGIHRDGIDQVYIGAAVSETFTGSTARLGRIVLDVEGIEPFEVTEDHFYLTAGEVLLDAAGQGPVVAHMAGAFGRALDPAVARIYHNRLEQNFPNPFNPTTTLAYSIKNGGHVSLTIYDVAGRRVRELVNERRERGAFKVVWNGQNEAGQTVASGVYFYKLVAGSFTDTKKMTILK